MQIIRTLSAGPSVASPRNALRFSFVSKRFLVFHNQAVYCSRVMPLEAATVQSTGSNENSTLKSPPFLITRSRRIGLRIRAISSDDILIRYELMVVCLPKYILNNIQRIYTLFFLIFVHTAAAAETHFIPPQPPPLQMQPTARLHLAHGAALQLRPLLGLVAERFVL